MSEHLTLPFYEGNLDRKLRRGRGPFKQHQDKGLFTRMQLTNLDYIKDQFEKTKVDYHEYFKPNMIFKIKVNQNVDEKNFESFLRAAKVRIISPSPDNQGYWITLAEEDNLEKLKKRLTNYGNNDGLNMFDAIESFTPIPPEEKIGHQLATNPLSDDEEAYLDIEIWRMEDRKLDDFVAGFKQLIRDEGGITTDTFVADDICLLRVKINKKIFTKITEVEEISLIDRPPRPYLTMEMLSTPLDEFDIDGSPSKDSTAIAILDSGVISNHPLLDKCIGDEISIDFKNIDGIDRNKTADDVGHGTKVAGVALYGDLRKCVQDRSFKKEITILSAKIMLRVEDPQSGEVHASYKPEELVEHQLDKVVNYFVTNYPNCKVFNISFGNKYKRMKKGMRQFAIANLIDNLAKKYNVIFVISAGNINEHFFGYPDHYPDYLMNDNYQVKVVDTASSVYAFTVGSIAQEFGAHYQSGIYDSPCLTNFPSPFTSVGPGYKDMIKPDLVEEGGNVILDSRKPYQTPDPAGNMLLLNWEWLSGSPHLFTLSAGTSYAAPKVANICARVFNKFPHYSANLIKSLILSSASIPQERPSPLDIIKNNASDIELMKLLNIYGYGKPNYEIAASSENNNVVLLTERKIGLNKVHIYYFYLPEEFVNLPGNKEISVSLVFDPPVKANRLEYLGCVLEFHLFKNVNVEQIISSYNSIKINNASDDIVPDLVRHHEIRLKPGVNIRKRGIHQKGSISYSHKPGIDTKYPLVLAVLSQNRWIRTDSYLQDYAVVVRVKHEIEIDLYNHVKQKIQQRLEQRIRI